MKFNLPIILLLLFPLLAACVDYRIDATGTQQEMEYLEPSDRDLRIAANVVSERLREVKEKDDWEAIKPLAPQIYSLANALLTKNFEQSALPAKASRTATLLPAEQKPTTQYALPVLLPLEKQQISPATKLHLASMPKSTSKPITKENNPVLAPAPQLDNAKSLFFAMQIGSYRDQSRAIAGWNELKAKAPEIFSGLRPRIEQVDLGAKGVFMRLKAGPIFSETEVMERCQQLQSQGISCIETDFTGLDQG
ncbi:MAG: SPOR domain-containing protein [Robiginitomaculum sp.]|nr:SPOR domain-containing protein [Robiginitomaculum sp.]